MQTSSNSQLPLIEAITRGDAATIKRLLQEGEPPNPSNHSEEAPLQVAARYGNLDVVRELLAAGAEVDRGYDYPPLYEAVLSGQPDVVRALVESGANVNATLDEDKNKILIEAVAEGNLDIVRILVEAGADVNFKGESGTPLLEAIESGHREIYEFLRPLVTDEAILEQADISAPTRLPITSVIKQRKENISVENFVKAASEGDLEKVKLAIDRGIDINSIDSEGRLALVEAVGEGHFQVIQALLDAGADIDLFDEREDGSAYQTALMRAVKTRCPERSKIISLLIASGASIDLQDPHGLTALMYALAYPGAAKDLEEGVRLMVQAGANLNIRDSAGFTVLAYAQRRGLKKMASFLETCGARS